MRPVVALVVVLAVGCGLWRPAARPGTSYRQVHCADAASWRDTSGCRRPR